MFPLGYLLAGVAMLAEKKRKEESALDVNRRRAGQTTPEGPGTGGGLGGFTAQQEGSAFTPRPVIARKPAPTVPKGPALVTKPTRPPTPPPDPTISPEDEGSDWTPIETFPNPHPPIPPPWKKPYLPERPPDPPPNEKRLWTGSAEDVFFVEDWLSKLTVPSSGERAFWAFSDLWWFTSGPGAAAIRPDFADTQAMVSAWRAWMRATWSNADVAMRAVLKAGGADYGEPGE